MLKRILFEDWHLLIPIVGFAVTFSAFLFFSLRAFLMRPRDVSRLSALPLEPDHTPPSPPSSHGPR